MSHYFAHQSGLLRELLDGSLEFVHRTFRDHLAAKEVVEEENLTLMLDNADKPHWHDVVVMAGAHARPRERAKILLELLDRGQTNDEHRDTLYLLAAAVVEQAAVLPRPGPRSPDVRALVSKAIAELIPPRTSAKADQLAAAGPFVLDLMPGPEGLTDKQAKLMVRAAARIAAQWNPPGAVEKILQFTTIPNDWAIDELLEAWGRLGDYETYARNVLSEIDFSRFTVDLQNAHRIKHITYLRTITTLILRNNVFDLSPLADLPNLRWLTLRDNRITALQSMAHSLSLRVLILDHCASMAGARPVVLSPLKQLRLSRLVISGLMTEADLSTLDGVHLVSLRLTIASQDSLAALSGLHVRHLTLAVGARKVQLAGVRGVRSIILAWAPNKNELVTLAEMPELRRLILWRVPPETPKPTLPGVTVTVCPRPTAGN